MWRRNSNRVFLRPSRVSVMILMPGGTSQAFEKARISGAQLEGGSITGARSRCVALQQQDISEIGVSVGVVGSKLDHSAEFGGSAVQPTGAGQQQSQPPVYVRVGGREAQRLAVFRFSIGHV